MRNRPIKATIKPGLKSWELPTLETPGIDWGRPLVIQYQAGDYLVTRSEAHKTWAGRGKQKHIPAEWRFIVLKGGQATFLLKVVPGRRARAVEDELKDLANAWETRSTWAASGGSYNVAFHYKDGVLSYTPGHPGSCTSSREVTVNESTDQVDMVELLIQSCIGHWDNVQIKGRIPARHRKTFLEARELIARAHLYLP